MLLTDYKPRSMMVAQQTRVLKPRFPVIDSHNHMFGGWDQRSAAELIAVLDEAGVREYVDLDGGWGEALLQSHLDRFKAAEPERFHVFGGVDWDAWPGHGHGFGEWAAGRLRQQAAWGAEGLKIHKAFGLHVKDDAGALVAVDDARLDPLWASAGELGLPVLIHVADPVAFFQPLDAHNERWEELQGHPDWHFPSPPFPSFESLVEALARLVARHPRTTFVGAHVGCYAENLMWVSKLLERCPNFNVDISARIAELGRQPYAARRFCMQHADRIVFGTDMSPDVETYRIYYRFLETEDEYFAYDRGEVPGQGRWRIYGLNLPDDVLRKVYASNAERILTRQ
jgi:predicted TIM-barrel fold metal-dependent hydrolase